MKKARHLVILAASLCLLSCVSNQKSTGELVTIDVSKDYPEQEIKLSDIAEVSYVRFDSSDDNYLTKGTPIAITPKTVIFSDFQSGDFFIFSTDGTPKAHFNHKGNGPEEYLQLISAIYDDKTEELFIVEKNKIKVYGPSGEYKRSLSLPKDAWIYEITRYDDDSFILFDTNEMSSELWKEMDNNGAFAPSGGEDYYSSSFVRISKANGKILEYIPVPENFRTKLRVQHQIGEMKMAFTGIFRRIVASDQGVLLCNQETDTIFRYSENTLVPVWVHTPPIQDMDPKAYVNGFVEAGDYQFFEKVTLKIEKTPPPPSTYYARNRHTGEIFKQKILFDDYPGKEVFISPTTIFRTRDGKLGHLILSTEELKQAEADNKLGGPLKELAASMNEDENDVLVLLRFK